MKKSVWIMITIIFFISFNPFISISQENNFSIIEVLTPSQEIYDSGIYRVLYKTFYIVDKNNQKVISCGDVFDKAAKVKLHEGSYTIYYQNLKGNVQQKTINIENNTYLQLVLN